MHVSSITVEFGRSRQPQPYETATAKVSLTAVFPEDDSTDYVANAQMLLGKCKTLVLQELALVPAGQSASVADVAGKPAKTEAAAPAPEAAKTETAAQRKKREAAEASANRPAAAASSDIPGEDDTKGKHTPVVTKATVNDDIPDGGVTATAKAATGLTHEEIHGYVSKQIADKKIDPTEVKKITATFNKPRIADLAVTDLPAYKAKLDARIAELGNDL